MNKKRVQVESIFNKKRRKDSFDIFAGRDKRIKTINHFNYYEFDYKIVELRCRQI